MNDRPDPRIHAYRADMAAAGLEGRVAAPRFVDGRLRQVVAAAAPMAQAPRDDSALGSEALFGEAVTVYEERDGWAWGQLSTDDYVGYFPSAALGDPDAPATHRVAVPRTCLYPRPDLRSRPARLISLNAHLRVAAVDGDFASLAGSAGYVFARHIATIGTVAPDYVMVAESLLATPYLWGGRQSLGLDCSALVQLSLDAAGIACPRDSDMQSAAVGAPLDTGDLSHLRRGDLVFWKGHVGIMLDSARLLHASGHHMMVVVEPLVAAVARIAGSGNPVSAIRRLADTP